MFRLMVGRNWTPYEQKQLAREFREGRLALLDEAFRTLWFANVTIEEEIRWQSIRTYGKP